MIYLEFFYPCRTRHIAARCPCVRKEGVLFRRGKNLQKTTPGKGRKYIKAVTAASAPHYFARRLFVVLYVVRRAGIAPALYLTSRIYSPLPSLLGSPTHIKAGGKGILDASYAALRIFAMCPIRNLHLLPFGNLAPAPGYL